MNLLGLVETFGAVAIEMDHLMNEAVENACKIIEKSAKDAIGTYEFGWPALQPETIARKATGDSPLLETGELRESIEHQTHGSEGDVGTNDPKAEWMEFGTKRGIPPRPFMGGAVAHTEKELEAEFVKVVGDVFKRHP